MRERNTKQKQIVSQVIKTANRPLNVREVLEHGQSQLPNLGIATVYREINRLCEQNEIKIVNIPGDTLRYEITKQHHHHFKCNECDKVYDVDGCLEGIKKLVPKGFKSSSHEITFYGLCKECI